MACFNRNGSSIFAVVLTRDDLLNWAGRFKIRCFSGLTILKILLRKANAVLKKLNQETLDSVESDAYFGIIVYHIQVSGMLVQKIIMTDRLEHKQIYYVKDAITTIFSMENVVDLSKFSSVQLHMCILKNLGKD